MSQCCLQGIVYAADDCRPIWAVATHGVSATTTYLEFDLLAPYTGAVESSPNACGNSATPGDTTVISDNGNGTGTITNPDTNQSLTVCLTPCGTGGGDDTTTITGQGTGTITITNPDTGATAQVCEAPCDGGGLDGDLEANGDGTVDVTIGTETETLLRTFRVNAGRFGLSESYDPANAAHIMLMDRNVGNGGDGAGNPGGWPYSARADIDQDACTTRIWKRGIDGVLVGPPEHDIVSTGQTFPFNPTGIEFSVDVDGVGPHDIFRQDLGECTNPLPCRASSLRVDYILTGAMFCIPFDSAVLIDAFITGTDPVLGSGAQRITATGSLNRSFDACNNGGPVAEDIGGGMLVNIAGGIEPGQVLDLGEFVMDMEFIGFQSQTANPFQMLVNVFPALTVRCTWITENI